MELRLKHVLEVICIDFGVRECSLPLSGSLFYDFRGCHKRRLSVYGWALFTSFILSFYPVTFRLFPCHNFSIWISFVLMESKDHWDFPLSVLSLHWTLRDCYWRSFFQAMWFFYEILIWTFSQLFLLFNWWAYFWCGSCLWTCYFSWTLHFYLGC